VRPGGGMTSRTDNIIAHGLERYPSFYLSGAVDDDMLKNCYLSLHSLGISKPITIFLNSMGGDLGTAWSIYDLIRNHGSEVNIVVINQCCSAASVILQAGVRRFISENSFIMIHAGHFEEQPDLPVETRKNWMRLAKYHSDKMVGMYSKLMGITPLRVKKLIRSDQIFIGAEAIAVGLVDAVW